MRKKPIFEKKGMIGAGFEQKDEPEDEKNQNFIYVIFIALFT